MLDLSDFASFLFEFADQIFLSEDISTASLIIGVVNDCFGKSIEHGHGDKLTDLIEQTLGGNPLISIERNSIIKSGNHGVIVQFVYFSVHVVHLLLSWSVLEQLA